MHSWIKDKLQIIEEGKHDYQNCAKYSKRYKSTFGQDLPYCQFIGNKSKIQKLMRKLHIDADGNATEVQF